MGVVYKADDNKLERLAAIKFLPRQIAASEGSPNSRAHIIEAQLAAVLNHPNLATIYTIEEAQILIDPGIKKSRGEMFSVMEFIEAGNQEILD